MWPSLKLYQGPRCSERNSICCSQHGKNRHHRNYYRFRAQKPVWHRTATSPLLTRQLPWKIALLWYLQEKRSSVLCGSDSVMSGINSTICFINHNYIANAHTRWNPQKEFETTHAPRYVKVGGRPSVSPALANFTPFRNSLSFSPITAVLTSIFSATFSASPANPQTR